LYSHTLKSVQFILLSDSQSVCDKLKPVDYSTPIVSGDANQECAESEPYLPQGFFGSERPMDYRIRWRVSAVDVVYFSIAAFIVIGTVAAICYMCFKLLKKSMVGEEEEEIEDKSDESEGESDASVKKKLNNN
jgi:hypothetical protein